MPPDEPILPPPDAIAPEDEEGARIEQSAEVDELIRRRQDEARVLVLEADARKAGAAADLERANAEKIRAETSLIEAQRAQAGDDRWLRLGAAVATFIGVGSWIIWLSHLVVRVGSNDFARGGNVPPEVMVALIVNMAIALVGLFAVILRGLFKVGE